MKINLFLISFLTISLTSTSQIITRDTVVFKDNSKHYTEFYDWSNLKKSSVFNVYPLNVLGNGVNEGVSFSVSGTHYLNQKASVSAFFAGSYSKSEVNEIPNNLRPIFTGVSFEYSVFSTKKDKQAPVYISQDKNILYRVNYKAIKSHDFLLTSGFDFGNGLKDNIISQIDTTNYYRVILGKINVVNFTLGVIHESNRVYSYKNERSNFKMRFWKSRIRNYMLLSYSPIMNYKLYASENKNDYIYETEFNGDLVKPIERNRIGFRIGFDVKIPYCYNFLVIGAEVSQFSSLNIFKFNEQNSLKESTVGGLGGQFKIGFQFGPKSPKVKKYLGN